MTQISPSLIMDPIVAKPKRKYTKKSLLLPQARAEAHGQVDLQTRQENNELLYSDRGLILKTQIPKKGRPISKHSTTSSQTTTASSQQMSFRHHQPPEYQVPTSHRRYVSSPIDQGFSGEELEYRNVEGDPQYPERRRRTVDTLSAMPRSFAEGVTAQMNTLKRSSSGMQKSHSMDGYHGRSIENKRKSVVGGSVGGGGRGTIGYGTDGQFEDVNEETGSNFFDEEFDDSAADARSRKRTSGSDLDYLGVDGIGAGRVGYADGGSVRRSINLQGGNKTWHGATLGSERRRPRSLVLPRGRGEPALPWTNMLDSGSGE
ncbi:hypothetical protein BGX30_013400 [Mortierella sp. GBA39]|nr:hypothetical protein BGX30_013400 [Mortierella sp. GBA39]